MDMEIVQRTVGDVTVLDLSGPLVGGSGTTLLKDKSFGPAAVV